MITDLGLGSIGTKTSGSATQLGGREGWWAKGDQVTCTSVRRVGRGGYAHVGDLYSCRAVAG